MENQTATPGGTPPTATSHPFLKGVFVVLALIVLLIASYWAVYWWTYRGMADQLSLEALRGQVSSQQTASNVQSQLRELGYEFDPQEFFQLNNPSSSSYKANVLNAFEPEPQENEEAPEGFYFYEEDGQAYYFELDEKGEIDRDSFTPLTAH